MPSRIPLAFPALAVMILLSVAVSPGLALTAPDKSTTTAGHNAFAIDLYTHLGQDEGNIFFSPFSISTALAMTYAGARGQTAREMAEVLHFGDSSDLLHQANRALVEDMTTGDDEGTQIALANRLWPAKSLSLHSTFLDLVAKYYQAKPQPLDFAGQPDQSRLAINQWAADNTAQMIQDLLHKNDITPQTMLVLTNAIYFRGTWANPFDPGKTRQGAFHLGPGKSIETQFMKREGRFGYASLDNVQVLQMPYADSDLAFVVILPTQTDGLKKLEAQLSPMLLDNWLSGLKKQTVTVILPRFEMTHRAELKEVLGQLGIVSAFSGQADFSGMTDSKIFIDQVIHKAKVMVHEEGTEAAAATAVIMEKIERSPFRADHPFLLLIRDTRTGSILFMGRLADPRS